LKAKKLYSPKVQGRWRSRVAGAIAPIVALASGKGGFVRLDAENYVYNVGYAKGSGGKDYEHDKNARRTGRSYGASIERNSYDPSDRDYLEDLGSYVSKASKKELEKFYRTLFEILLKVDTSGIKSLNKKGQTLMADFMAIYMAEQVRHLMTGLKLYEWENALTEITMLAAFSAHPEGLTFDPRGGSDNATNGRELAVSGKLKPKQLMVGFFGVGTDGSGLDGRNKGRRHVLTRGVVTAMKEINPAIVRKIQKLIGSRKTDIYDEAMEFINAYGTQKVVRAQADQMIDSLVQFVMETRANALQIQETIQGSCNTSLARLNARRSRAASKRKK